MTLSEGEQGQMLLSVNVQLQRDLRGFQVDLVFCKEDSLSKKKKVHVNPECLPESNQEQEEFR